MALKRTMVDRKKRARGKPDHKGLKCTEDLIYDFCFHIKRMIPATTVCDLMGIGKTTYQNWKRYGREYEKQLDEGEKPNPDHEIYFKFFDSERRAQGHWKVRVIERSLNPKELKSTWVRDMTILERRDRDNWGKKDFLEVAENEHYDPDESFL